MTTNGHFGRRTFAIISHPDAGKTTLTEKLLYFGGAIRAAGEVRAKGERRRARSDWLAIEQKRGISVTSSAMTFIRDGIVFNLLDTPGHEDFSEDTYRTLTAVDSAIMVIDAAKGIEAQTRKLFEVCRMRDVPIITFINKIDREGKDPFALLDEVADTLALDVAPLMWPAGMGGRFRGTLNLTPGGGFSIPDGTDTAKYGTTVPVDGVQDPRLADYVPADQLEEVKEQVELATEGYAKFDRQSFLEGHLTPIFFGSALKEFAVEDLLAGLSQFAPPPRPSPAEPAPIDPDDDQVSGFVFKVQANMDPNHRDRVAFMRICSGTFRRGMKLKLARTDKPLAINAPIFFLAQERERVEEARPGDIIGIPNHGALNVGDTLFEKTAVEFTGLPDFAPEIIRRVRLDDPMKSKALKKAVQELCDEGISQLFYRQLGADLFVGVVGQLQLDVIETRLEAEYKIPAKLEPSGFEQARWITATDQKALDTFMAKHRSVMAEDGRGLPVFLGKSAWDVDYAEKNAPEGVRFHKTRERKTLAA